MKIRVTEEKLRSGGYDLVKDDVVTVPDALGKRWCAQGWAKDMDGKVPTGDRVVRGATVEPRNAKHAGKAKGV